VAADPDPYFSFPALYGAPAYSRAPRAVPDSERPFDPDDLPIVAAQTEDEKVVAQTLLPSGMHSSRGGRLHPAGGSKGNGAPHGNGAGADGNGSNGMSARRFSLRALTDRLTPRDK